MQALMSISLLVLPVVMVRAPFAAQAADEPASPPPPAQAVATAEGPAATASAHVFVMPAPASTTATSAADASATPSGTTASATAVQPASQNGFGVAMSNDQLDEHRGGDALIGQNYLTGSVASNSAYKVETGSNSISDGSFTNSNGLPTVIQNTGANVLIQNATVLNVRFGN
jgi:hypothetical protein